MGGTVSVDMMAVMADCAAAAAACSAAPSTRPVMRGDAHVYIYLTHTSYARDLLP